MNRINLPALIALGLALVVLDGLITVASAADVTITCQAPTQNTDGSTLTNLSGFHLYGGRQGETKTVLDTRTACSFLRPNVATATHEYYVTAFNSAGVESDPSAMAMITVTPLPPPDGDGDGVPDASDQCPTVVGVAPTGCPLKPNPPPSITVKQLLAYEMRGTVEAGNLRMVRVGRVFEGTQCLQTTATVAGKTYQQLPDRAVVNDMALEQLTKAPKVSPVLWGLCA